MVFIGLIVTSFALVSFRYPEMIGASDVHICAGGSMAPAINPGDIEVFRQPNEIEIGDIVAFTTEDGVVSHRIIKVSDRGFWTKGDANQVADSWVVPEDAIVGEFWFRIPYLGFVMAFIGENLFFYIIVIGGLVVVSRVWNSYELVKNGDTATVQSRTSEISILQRIAKAYYFRGAWYHDVLTGSGYRKKFKHRNEQESGEELGQEVEETEEAVEEDDDGNSGAAMATEETEQEEPQPKQSRVSRIRQRYTEAYRLRGLWWRRALTGVGS